jgi:hypothetical protein
MPGGSYYNVEQELVSVVENSAETIKAALSHYLKAPPRRSDTHVLADIL